MTEELEHLQQRAQSAVEFIRMCRNDPTSYSTGAMRDAREWMEEIVTELSTIDLFHSQEINVNNITEEG